MFFELIAALAAGFAAGGLALLARKILPVLPRWLVPAAAAMGLFAMTIYNEYNWASRTAEGLPEGLVVVNTVPERSLFRPWSYLWPVTHRFLAVDEGTALRRDAQVMADQYFFARWQAPRKVTSVYDCANAQRADLTAEVELAADGSVENANWRPLETPHPVLDQLCQEGGDSG